MAKKALIVWGGWDGHQPKEVGAIFDRELKKLGFETEVSPTLDAFNDKNKLKALDLIVPIWTMGKISGEQCGNVCEAVKNGVGIGGVHGGMCDAFREATEWQFMTGGQWVAHPGNDGLRYKVRITAKNFITDGVPVEFDVASEQYYMHTDPSNKVLATTTMPVADGPHAPNGVFEMPVTWTRLYGKGRVFYCSLGHQANIIEQPPVLRMCVRGLLWAGNAESLGS